MKARQIARVGDYYKIAKISTRNGGKGSDCGETVAEMSLSHVARRPLALCALLVVMVALAAGAAAFEQGPLAIETGQGRFEFEVELAVTPQERARGLMFRESLADDRGMLFDFGAPKAVTMWMRNTYIPLDIVFIRADGSISRIARNTEPMSDRIIASGEPVSAVLELRGGLTSERGIAAGDQVIHDLFD